MKGDRSQPKMSEASASWLPTFLRWLWLHLKVMETYLIMHPLGYFASAPSGTPDAAILSDLVSRYGDYLERLDSEQKLALRAVLSYYLFYKLKYKSNYSVNDAVIDAMPDCATASISKIILALEGISNYNAEGLVKFLTEQRQERAVVLGAEPISKTQPMHSSKPAIVDRLATVQQQLQQMGQNHQTELDALLLQVQTDFEAVNRELKSIRAFMLSLHGHGSSAHIDTAQGGQQ